jgi:hypothetical protein
MKVRVIKVQHLTSGYAGILKSPGVEAEVQATARREAQKYERQTKTPYTVEKLARATSRPVYVAKPERIHPTGYLTHEKWIEVVWPMVGGPKWRPNRNQKGYQGKKR